MVRNLTLSTVPAALATALLFCLMYSLIHTDDLVLDEREPVVIWDWVRVPEPLFVVTTPRTPERPEPPAEPPSAPVPHFDPGGVPVLVSVFTPPQLPGTGGISHAPDGGYLPIVKVQPAYPRRALQREQTGWVIVEFTVDNLGRPTNVEVKENCVMTRKPDLEGCWDSPGSVFNSSALAAARKFRYKPRVLGGSPVSTAGVRHKITFELAD